jgi:hypothetical protein
MRFAYCVLSTALVVVTLPVFAQESVRSTEEVLDHHLTAFGEGDVDAIVSDYADDAVIITQGGVVQGEEIRALFETLVAEFAKPGMSFELVNRQTRDEVAYIVWIAETADNVYEFATDTFVIRKGQIAYQTLSAKTTAK